MANLEQDCVAGALHGVANTSSYQGHFLSVWSVIKGEEKVQEVILKKQDTERLNDEKELLNKFTECVSLIKDTFLKDFKDNEPGNLFKEGLWLDPLNETMGWPWIERSTFNLLIRHSNCTV